MSTVCPECKGRTKAMFLREYGKCFSCRQKSNRELVGVERETAIKEHLKWLNGRMPSQAIRDCEREPVEVVQPLWDRVLTRKRHKRTGKYSRKSRQQQHN